MSSWSEGVASVSCAWSGSASSRATRRLEYRGYRIAIAAVARCPGVIAFASLAGGRDGIVRTFAVPCVENEVTLACDTVCHELRQVIDDLEGQRGRGPARP